MKSPHDIIQHLRCYTSTQVWIKPQQLKNYPNLLHFYSYYFYCFFFYTMHGVKTLAGNILSIFLLTDNPIYGYKIVLFPHIMQLPAWGWRLHQPDASLWATDGHPVASHPGDQVTQRKDTRRTQSVTETFCCPMSNLNHWIHVADDMGLVLLTMDFPTRLLIGWQPSCQPVRSFVGKFLLSNIQFKQCVRNTDPC